MATLPQRDPRDKDKEQFSINLPRWLAKRLDEIGAAEGYARAEIIRLVMKSFVEEWDEKHAGKKQSR